MIAFLVGILSFLAGIIFLSCSLAVAETVQDASQTAKDNATIKELHRRIECHRKLNSDLMTLVHEQAARIAHSQEN